MLNQFAEFGNIKEYLVPLPKMCTFKSNPRSGKQWIADYDSLKRNLEENPVTTLVKLSEELI